MLDLTTGQYAQLIVGLILAVLVFIAAYFASPRRMVAALVLLTPFQFIASPYGTANVGMVLLCGLAHLLRGRIKTYPALGSLLALMFAVLVSAAFATRGTWIDHATYVIALGSAMLLFIMMYNIARGGETASMLKVFVVLNVLVLAYCYVQLLLGFEHFYLFGNPDLGIRANRADVRLSGPFAAVGITAEYLMISIIIIGYLLMHQSRRRYQILLLCLAGANFAFMVATGNRGAFLTLLACIPLFLWLFRKRLRIAGAVTAVTAGMAIFAVAAFVTVTYTEFNRLFDRLEETQVEGVVPDTRQITWPLALDEIAKSPIIGHGPRMRPYDIQGTGLANSPIPYPHNLYLYLLYSTGVVGLVAFLSLLASLAISLWRAHKPRAVRALDEGLPTLGLLVLMAFMVDQIKVEFLRFELSDYWQWIFALFGLFMGTADRLWTERRHAASRIARTTFHGRAGIEYASGGSRVYRRVVYPNGQ